MNQKWISQRTRQVPIQAIFQAASQISTNDMKKQSYIAEKEDLKRHSTYFIAVPSKVTQERKQNWASCITKQNTSPRTISRLSSGIRNQLSKRIQKAWLIWVKFIHAESLSHQIKRKGWLCCRNQQRWNVMQRG